jgi:RNA polymerase sigma factor (sigma-70 family)
MPPLKSQLRLLKKILLRRGATREDAEDLVQEAVLRLHVYARAGGQVRDQDAFVTRCALNLAVDAHRHARGALYERSPVEDLDLTDNGPTPDEVFEAEQRLVEMMQTLDRVSVRTRQVFFMHRLQGFSHAEIASKLDVSKSAVEKHIASAVTILAMERLAHGSSGLAHGSAGRKK